MKRFSVTLVFSLLTALTQPVSGADAAPPLHAFRFGTPRNEVAWGLTGHPSGVYVVGTTHGELHGPQRGGGDAFIRKVSANGAVLWAEQFGTAEADNAWKVGTDAAGNVYVVGSTEGDLAGPSHARSCWSPMGVYHPLQFVRIR